MPLPEAHAQIERQRLRCRKSTQLAFSQLLGVWEDYLALMYQALAGEHDHGEEHFRDLNSRFFVVALNTSLAVRECCLDGLYVQGAALCRHLLETWPIVVYNRLNPQSAYSWLTTEDKAATPPSHGTTFKVLLKQPDYRSNAMVVEKNYRECNKLAHPSERVLTAHETNTSGFQQLGPGLNPRHARQLLGMALVATSLIVSELPHNLNLDQLWRGRRQDSEQQLAVALAEEKA
jgi:hypothetical protein